MAFLNDRMASISSGWAGSLDEQDISVELPCKYSDFVRGHSMVENTQTLASPDLFTNHPADTTDSLVMVGRCFSFPPR